MIKPLPKIFSIFVIKKKKTLFYIIFEDKKHLCPIPSI